MFKLIMVSLVIFGFSAVAQADNFWSGSPTPFRLQNYPNGGIMVWNVSNLPANCPQGSGLLTDGLSDSDKNRFYATILSAKLVQHSVYMFYNPANCRITSFGMDQ